VPSVVAMTVATTPTRMLLPKAVHTCGAPHGFCQLSSVKPRQMMLLRPESLNENRMTCAIGSSR